MLLILAHFWGCLRFWTNLKIFSIITTPPPLNFSYGLTLQPVSLLIFLGRILYELLTFFSFQPFRRSSERSFRSNIFGRPPQRDDSSFGVSHLRNEERTHQTLEAGRLGCSCKPTFWHFFCLKKTNLVLKSNPQFLRRKKRQVKIGFKVMLLWLTSLNWNLGPF